MKSTSSTSTKQSNGKPKSVEQTTAAPTTATAAVTKVAKPVDPQIEAAKQALLKARADKKAAEEKAKEQRKAERAAKAAERAAVKAAPRPTCTGTKKDGSNCTAKAKEGSDRCIDHQPAIARLTQDERNALRQLIASKNRDGVIELLVSEIGWFRAKQIAKEHTAPGIDSNTGNVTTATAA